MQRASRQQLEGDAVSWYSRRFRINQFFKNVNLIFFSPFFLFPPNRVDLTYRISPWESIHYNVTEFSRLMKVKLSGKHMKTCCVELLSFPVSVSQGKETLSSLGAISLNPAEIQLSVSPCLPTLIHSSFSNTSLPPTVLLTNIMRTRRRIFREVWH